MTGKRGYSPLIDSLLDKREEIDRNWQTLRNAKEIARSFKDLDCVRAINRIQSELVRMDERTVRSLREAGFEYGAKYGAKPPVEKGAEREQR